MNLIELCNSTPIVRKFMIDLSCNVHYALESLCSKIESSTSKNTVNITSITIAKQRCVILKLISTVLVNTANFTTATTLKHMPTMIIMKLIKLKVGKNLPRKNNLKLRYSKTNQIRRLRKRKKLAGNTDTVSLVLSVWENNAK